jgi:hypothetical protein
MEIQMTQALILAPGYFIPSCCQTLYRGQLHCQQIRATRCPAHLRQQLASSFSDHQLTATDEYLLPILIKTPHAHYVGSEFGDEIHPLKSL